MACQEAPALIIEKHRLQTIGGSFLGIIGDANHSFGYHLCNPPASDYSRAGAVNAPVGEYACAIDIGMNWAASRQWLPWLITEIREDRIKGIAEVIGSLDGRNVRYWSDGSGWSPNGVAYTGTGHDTWTHVAIYRATAKQDHGILAGWNATGYQGSSSGGSTMGDYSPLSAPNGVKFPDGRVRGDSILLADNWGQEHHGVSPYDGKTKSHRSTLLDRMDTNIKTLLDRDLIPITLEDADILAIAEQVADRIGAQLASLVADEIARRMSD